MADELRHPPRPFVWWGYSSALVGCGVLLFAHSQHPIAWTVPLLVLLIATLVSENYALSLPVFKVSLAFPLLIGTMILFGPAAAGLAAALSFTNLSELRAHRPMALLAFNFGQLVMSACVGGWVYVGAGGRVLGESGLLIPLMLDELPGSCLALLIASAVTAGLNMVLTSWAAKLLGISPFREAIRAMAAYAPTQLALAGVGLLVAQVLAINLFALPLFLVPLILARSTYQRYEALKGVYLDTVRSLVAALEAKDPYTKGHSERVARYALAIGRSLGMRREELQTLGRAALLHDIGKLALSSTLLTKIEPLTDEEFDVIRDHPVIGAHMIERIPLLSELAPYVESHHQRPDGAGYPRSSSADILTPEAKVLAVADAYDAMTTNRPYREALSHEEAVSELKVGVNAQFDHVTVQAFVRTSLADLEDLGPEILGLQLGGFEGPG